MSELQFERLKSCLAELRFPATFEETRAYLSNLQGSEYDFILLCQLFAKINKDTDAEINLEEFLTSLIGAEQMINHKIEQLTTETEVCRTQVNLNLDKSEQFGSTDRMNDNGISVDSELSVNIQVLELKKPVSNVFVTVEFSEQQRRTKVKSDELVFNESFKLGVVKAEGEIRFKVCQVPKIVVGELAVPLEMLKSQMESEANFAVYSGQTVVGTIKMKLQWLWDFALYHAKLAEHWDEQLVQISTEIQYLNSQVHKLMLPFSLDRHTPASSLAFPSKNPSEARPFDSEMSLESIQEVFSSLDFSNIVTSKSKRSSVKSKSNPNQTNFDGAPVSFIVEDYTDHPVVELDEERCIEELYKELQAEREQATDNDIGRLELNHRVSLYQGTPDLSSIGEHNHNATQVDIVVKSVDNSFIADSNKAKDASIAPTSSFDPAPPTSFAIYPPSSRPTSLSSTLPQPSTQSTRQQTLPTSLSSTLHPPASKLSPPSSMTFPSFSHLVPPASSPPALTSPILPLFLVLSLLITIGRTDFINVSSTQVLLVSLLMFQADLKISQPVLMIAIITSQVIDLVWIWLFNSDPSLPEASVQGWAFWLSVSCFVVKCGLLKHFV
jgi:hypothetical protein